MTIAFDNAQLMASLDTLPTRIRKGINGGLSDAAKVGEEIMQTSPAHGDMSGAAHQSSFVGVLGVDAQERADAAYETAASLLANFKGHDGKPERITVEGNGPGLILGRPINYAKALEDGGKAVVGPTFQEIGSLALRMASEGVAAELGR